MNRASETSIPAFDFSRRALLTSEQPISYLMHQGVSNPNLISLAAGLVDYETLPVEEMRQLSEELFSDEAAGRIALQYGASEGLASLRKLLLEHLAGLDDMNVDEYPATADDVLLTTGSQQMLFILADILLNPGDIVITASPTYYVYAGLLQTFDADVRPIAIDENGMIPEALEATLAEIDADGELDRVKIVYTCDYHQNPTGITLSAERREPLLEIVKRYSRSQRILLLEDSAYRELTYEGSPPPSIKRYDKDNHYVALLQTFSKPFAPGLKTGYAVLPSDLVPPIVQQKGNHDFGSVNLAQHLLLRAMKQGVYDEHLGVLCERYTTKRDAMIEALEVNLAGTGTTWNKPGGGLYVWLTLPEGLATGLKSKLFERALEAGVLYVPGDFCYPDADTNPEAVHTIRLSFGTATIEQIHEGVKRLAQAVKSCLD
ncbi:MAG: aminotransferase-like domain-containing protein [Planctomycetota bacterium]